MPPSTTTTNATTTTTHNKSCLDYDTEEQLSRAIGQMNLEEWRVVREPSQPPTTVQKKETQRLQTLKSYHILDTQNEDAFEQLTEKLYQHYRVPWACVSFVDMKRQWFKSMTKDDISLKEMPRTKSFCAHLVESNDPLLVVRDTFQDPRFQHNPYCTGEAGTHFRFYAGVPLVTNAEGERIGTLCVLDRKPRPEGLSEQEQKELQDRAAELMELLEKRRQTMVEQKKRTNSVDTNEIQKRTSFKTTTKKKRVVFQDIRKVDVLLPNPNTLGISPDQYLMQLVEAITGKVILPKRADSLTGYFQEITEEQVAAYTVQVTAAARENEVHSLRQIFRERGKIGLDCYNRFGEGLLNLVCRRGCKESAEFLLSKEVGLSVRVRDDYGRTPLHDLCWNPSPQLEICSWIMERDPSLFLVADKRGYTPFQYARKTDWETWKQFLYDNKDFLSKIAQPDILQHFQR